MKFNAKYNRYVSKDGLIYRLRHGVLILCKNSRTNSGYIQCSVHCGSTLVHRLVYETFNSEIPEGYEIDHINAVRDDNRLCNLQLLTHSENLKKRKKYSKQHKAIVHREATSEFGRLFREHYNIVSRENWNLYQREYRYYKRHNKCSWQLEEI